MHLPEEELERWRRYWMVEPWGSHRDNIHAAMICVQVLRPYLPANSKVGIDDFMLKDAKVVKQNRMAQLVSKMGASVNRMPAAKPAAAKAKHRSGR